MGITRIHKNDFVAAYDIKHNQRKHDVPYLRFIKEGEGAEVELIRNDIWALFLEGLSVRDIAKMMEFNKTSVHKHIQICKKMYDAWVSKNGLALHGDPANRLEDLLAEFDQDLDDITEMAKEAKDNDDIRGYKDLVTLKLAMQKEKGKYMGVEPPKQVNIEMTIAEESRKKMAELFPSDDVEDAVEEK